MAIIYPPRLLPVKERLDYWDAAVNSTFARTDNLALGDEPFDGRLNASRLGDLVIARIASTPIEYRRRARTDEDDHFFLSLTLDTQAQVEQSGRLSLQRRGDIVLFSSARPYRCRFAQGDDQIVLTIPRRRLVNYLPEPEALVSRTLGCQSTVAKLAGQMLVEVSNTAERDPRSSERLSSALLEVLAVAYESEFGLTDPGQSTRHHAQLTRAKDFLLANLHDTALDMTSIAQATHVSVRALSRLFAAQGTTVMRWLWQQRLDACRTALIKGQYRSVSEVALSMGFTNMAHFSKAYKTAYGVSPRTSLNDN